MSPAFSVRRASPDDLDAVLALFDEAIAWFNTFGNEGQWGSEPWSTQPRLRAKVSENLAMEGAYLAVSPDHTVAGCLILGQATDDVPAATEPELYVRVLISSRAEPARGAGRFLLDWAAVHASGQGLHLLRVDCYAGGTGNLVRFYESCGYTKLSTFEVDGWPGQVLAKRL